MHVKGRAVVYKTEGDDMLDDGTLISWRDSEWTAHRAIFDPSDLTIRPGGHCFRYPGWQVSEYELIRIEFEDNKDARHFAVEYGIEPLTL